MAVKLTNGIYEWVGWTGSTLVSYERGVKIGEVRPIAGHLLYVHSIKKRLFRKNKIN